MGLGPLWLIAGDARYLSPAHAPCMAAAGNALDAQRGCADAEFKVHDDALNAAYSAARSTLTASDQRVLRDLQRQWLRQRDNRCPEGGTAVAQLDAQQCRTLVSPALLQQATTAQNHKGWYGFGFLVQGEGREHQYGHEGGAPGSNSAIVVLPAQGYVIVGLANVDPDAIGNVVNYIARRVPL